MILWYNSNASYLLAPKAQLRAAGYHYLSNAPTKEQLASGQGMPMHNRAVHVACSMLRKVMASAAETKLAGLFHNSKTAYAIRRMLKELGHMQSPTPLQANNTTAIGIATKNVKQRRSMAMDMRFY